MGGSSPSSGLLPHSRLRSSGGGCPGRGGDPMNRGGDLHRGEATHVTAPRPCPPSASDRAWLVAQFPAPLAGLILAGIGILTPSGVLRTARAGIPSPSGLLHTAHAGIPSPSGV